METTVSIIVPIHNVEPYLRKCLDSIRSQTFKNFEVILVNDGSTDMSGEICDEFAKIDSRFKAIHREFNGVSSSRNTGLSIARGKYIAFVDGDDWIDKDMYMELYRLCTETNSDISVCRLGREINGKLINKEQTRFIKEMNRIEAMRELFKGAFYRFSLCNKLIKKSCFTNILFPEGRIHEDLSTTYKLFANSNKTVFTNYIGYIYVKRENSILTSSFSEKRLDAFMGWDEIMEFITEKYPQVSKEVTACSAHWCVDYIYYILHQSYSRKDRKIYMQVVQGFIRRHYTVIMKNDIISVKQKYMIFLLRNSITLLLISNRVKSFYKSNIEPYVIKLKRSKKEIYNE